MLSRSALRLDLHKLPCTILLAYWLDILEYPAFLDTSLAHANV